MLNLVVQYIQYQLGLKGYMIDNNGSAGTQLKLPNKNSSYLLILLYHHASIVRSPE